MTSALALGAFLVLTAMVRIQILQHKQYREAADHLHYQREVEQAERGSIYDSEGRALALTRYVYDIGITPSDLKSLKSKGPKKEDIIDKLSELLALPKEEVAKAAAQEKKAWIRLKQHVPRETYERLRAWQREEKIGGIAIDPTLQRIYPEGRAGSATLGFVSGGDEMHGVGGIEAYYDHLLSGRAGYRYHEVDNYGRNSLPYAAAIERNMKKGLSLKLHINQEIQNFAQKTLDDIVARYEIQEGGVAIVIKPQTGAILAMAQSGAFDPNKPYEEPKDWPKQGQALWNPYENKEDLNYLYRHTWLNRAISATYEPGSTYKVLTAGMGFNDKVVTEEDRFSDDPIRLRGWQAYPISWDGAGKHQMLTVEEGLWLSANPIFVQVAQKVGVKHFYDYVRAFGHRDLTGIDLPGEVNSIIHEDPNVVDMAVWSFGEQATVTPLQMATTFAAIANDGLLMKPQVLDEVLDDQGRPIVKQDPEPVRQIFSVETTRLLRRMMRSTVTDGTASVGNIPGYAVGAKTSTSTHGKNDEIEVISLASLAPYDHPEVAVLAIFFNPKDDITSYPAQIVNREITEKSLEVLGVKPVWTEQDTQKLFAWNAVRKVIGQTVKEAVQRSPIAFWNVHPQQNVPLSGEYIVEDQYPPPGTSTDGEGNIAVSVDGPIQEDWVPMVDFTGLDLTAARRLAKQADLNLQLLGNPQGVVTQQRCTAKQDEHGRVQRYSVVILNFE